MVILSIEIFGNIWYNKLTIKKGGVVPVNNAEKKIKRNIIKCNLCGDIIESKSRHDFVWCKCKKCFVDGGTDYIRVGFENRDDITFLTEHEDT